MGYIFDFNDARSYDAWFEKAGNRHAFELEMELLFSMLKPCTGNRLLSIGCGTGQCLEYFLKKDIQLTGVDPSPYMLDIAKKRLKNRVDLHRGFAEDLPFEDNAFEYAVFFTSLEFTEMPAKAIEEACRVAKDMVFIGVLNKWAPLNIIRRIKNLFVSNIFSRAQFFSIWELKHIVSAILGEVPVSWRTILHFPWSSGRVTSFFENLFPMQKIPFGTMIGMTITPVPKFKTRPLSLRIKKNGVYKPVTGFATNCNGQLNICIKSADRTEKMSIHIFFFRTISNFDIDMQKIT